jgi:uncharacterized repeat protein (TIGR01451 family)
LNLLRNQTGRSIGAAAIALLALAMLPAAASAATVDLGVTQTDSPDPAQTGEPLIYALQVSNAGPDAAATVRLVDKLPARVDLIDVRAPGASCESPNHRVVCSFGDLAAGATGDVTIRVRPTGHVDTYTITNYATVGKRKSDTRLADNVSREQTTVQTPVPVICAGREATIVGTDGNDSLVGTEGPDVIAALSGDDDILGLGGGDVVCGSGGRDLVSAGADADVVKGGGGDDKLKGGGGEDRIQGKGGADNLRGGHGSDVLRGGRGADRCRGGGGADVKRSC